MATSNYHKNLVDPVFSDVFRISQQFTSIDEAVGFVCNAVF